MIRYYEYDLTEGNKIVPLLKKNKYELPIGFKYKSSINKKEFNNFNEFEKMDILLEEVVIGENGLSNETVDLKSYDNKIDCAVGCIDIQCKNDKMYVTENSIIKINYPNIESGEGE